MDINVYGHIRVKGREFFRNEIATIDPEQQLIYGVDWDFVGSQESSIYAETEDGTLVFDDGFGRQALRKFLNWLKNPK